MRNLFGLSSLVRLFVLLVISSGIGSATALAGDLSSRDLRGAESEDGLFTVHVLDDERIIFEIPADKLERDMVVMSRYAQAQEGLAARGGGDRMTGNMVVYWERRGGRIVLRTHTHANTADPDSPLALAVANSNFAPVLASFPIAMERRGNVLIDVTELYLGDHPAFSFPRQRRADLGMREFDADRSWLEWARSFPENIEIRAVRSYEADEPPSNPRGGTVSFEINHSMILLPEEPMMPRLADERVTWITQTQTDYSRDFQGVRPYQYLRRYRLEPKDMDAFRRGELVEPKKPIVWYIDPATPKKWVPYFKAGIMEWESAFEKAGFKNAVDVKLAPTEEEDPDFSLLDARYNVIRYVATPVRSANAGGDVIDPRSGEVIRGHMNMYHGLDERLRWWLVTQVATANPRFRTSELSEEDLGEALRYVVSHEMAHAMGLPHNQRANFVYPVDGLRDPEFVAEWGHSASSVGRTRYNYIAQPGDEVPPERRIGRWDEFAIFWGYRPIPDAGTPEEELDTLNEWIVERADKPWFRSALPQFGMDVEWDPYRMTEGISDDPVRAAEYGMRNLRKAVGSLTDWLLSDGDDYYELETHYLQGLTQWNRYAEHAAAAVGGSWTHHKRVGEDGPVYTPIEADYQRQAMAFIDEHVLSTPDWALDMEMLRKLEHAGAVERIRAYQELAVQRLLNHARLARMIEHEAFLGDETYRPADMLDDAREMVWRELNAGESINTWRRNMQRAWLDQAHYLLHQAESEHWQPPASGNLRVGRNDDPPLNADLHIAQSDIHALLRDQLRLLGEDIDRALDNGIDDRMTRIHLEDARQRLDRALR
ncbi:zinc-dependent metalloprotease [Wenzhouxiangella sp. AB-CW3]|uniref:zinc-dependent metalloprotease n=1 Tax=Wenzhouxiangella sp. AB-CW3 TaxID=2771012 RepID=UPI00168A61BC|nr:zinc-dependent metalloprotease [Wenzhouxiangella sp. AB-CW3]QOC22731.1 zinc-dependent metalloprotease [Wenzhouxiangella sp. AB-CW3]